MKRLKVLLASAMTICAALSIYAGINPALAANAESASVQATAPAPPSLTKSIYNTAVSFTWTVGAGGDSVQSSGNNINWRTVHASTYTIYQFPNVWDHDNKCEPDDHLYRSYNTSTGLYSQTISLERLETNTDGSGVYHLYGELCKYSVVDGFDYSKIPYGESRIIPTEFDQTYYIWDHDSGWNHTIKGTIEYNNQISDIEVRIPLLGTVSTSVTLAGVEFSLRTGPNRCSIKVNQAGINVVDVQFMFGVE